MALESVNPATGELIERFEELPDRDLDARLQAAARAFTAWRRTSFAERAALMRRAAGGLRADVRRFAEVMTREMGKPIREARTEVEKCAWVCDHYAEHAERYLAPETLASDAERSYVAYEPLGPVFAIMPWNFPFWQVFRFAAPALMAGNTGLLKHASNVPGTAIAIEDVFREAGFPAGVFSSLLIGPERAAGVIRDERVAAVTVTGSEAAGRKVGEAAGGALKKSVLELGGSDPFLVLADADLDAAAKAAARGRMINSGQSCIAAKRFIALAPVAEDFKRRFRAALEALVMGDPMDERTDVGPLARADLRLELQRQVDASVAAGAELVLGGKIPGGRGFFYPPTLVAGARRGMPVLDEETFGPVAALTAVGDDEEAVRVANDTRFGLGAAIFTRDVARGEALARRIDAGLCFVNGIVKSDPRLPFGGVKQSGYGRELSLHGIREFMNAKTVWLGPARTKA
jgi:succinate-semialdehyde dehydrogenase/glutarate-semialdehyde dehydrogenase